jgi:excisionase family DNA binding protein
MEFPEIMKAKELCEYLSVGRDALDGLIKNGLPFFTLNNNPKSHKRFKKSDVDEWISKKSGKQPSPYSVP